MSTVLTEAEKRICVEKRIDYADYLIAKIEVEREGLTTEEKHACALLNIPESKALEEKVRRRALKILGRTFNHPPVKNTTRIP